MTGERPNSWGAVLGVTGACRSRFHPSIGVKHSDVYHIIFLSGDNILISLLYHNYVKTSLLVKREFNHFLMLTYQNKKSWKKF